MSCGSGKVVRLERDENEVIRRFLLALPADPDTRRYGAFRPGALENQISPGKGFVLRAARDGRYVRAGRGQDPAQISSDRAGAVDQNSHATPSKSTPAEGR